MDETYIKVKGVWKYLYRAVDRDGKTIDFLLTAKRDKAAAKRFFDKVMQANGVPEKVTMDKSGANKAAIDEINANREKPMLGFKSFQSAKNILAGIELMHMIRKGQMMMEGADKLSLIHI